MKAAATWTRTSLLDQPLGIEAGSGEPQESRIVGNVTIMITDIEGSTAASERLGERRWVELLHMHHSLVRHSLAAHRGVEVQPTGDGFIAFFRTPSDGLSCARAIQDAFAEHNRTYPDEQVLPRIGLHVGDVTWIDRDVFGRAMAVAVRVTGQACGGEIVGSQAFILAASTDGPLPLGRPRAASLKGLSGRYLIYSLARKRLHRSRVAADRPIAVAAAGI